MNRVLLTLGLVAMDVCSIYPWSVLLGFWTDAGRGEGLLSSLAVLVLVLGGAWTTHLLGGFGRRGRAARLALAALGALASAIVVVLERYPASSVLVSASVVAFAGGLYLWWRGTRFGLQTPGFNEVEEAFRWGIGRLAAFGVVLAATRTADVATVEGQTLAYVVGFFFFSLLTLALGRLESLRTRTRRPSLNRQWLAVLVLVAAGVVLLALLVAQIVSFDVLLVATQPLFDVLGLVLLLLAYAIVIPLAYLVQWIVYFVIALLPANASQQPPRPLQPADVDNLLQQLFTQLLPPEAFVALKALGAVLLLAIALLLMARGLTRWRPTSADADATDEQRDSLWDAAQAWALLRSWLRELFRRQRPPAALPGPGVQTSAVVDKGAPVASVRALYVDLLRRGALVGVSRAASTTPLEHEPALRATLTPAEAVHTLTSAYLDARYADLDLPAAEVVSLRGELEHIQAKGADR